MSSLRSIYYCPYCSPRYQFPSQRRDGILICGQCGELLVKKPFIKPTQIVAIIAALAFISPFLILIFSYFRDIQKPNPQRNIYLKERISQSYNRKILHYL